MNTIKIHRNDKTKVTLTKEIDGIFHSKTYKGVTLNNIPSEYNHWFNYRGLTFVIS